jgi:hypothetical protein
MALSASKLWALAAAVHPKLPKGWAAEVAFFQSYDLDDLGGPVEVSCDASFDDGKVWLTVGIYATLKVMRTAKFTQFENEIGQQLRAAGFQPADDEGPSGDAQDAILFEQYLTKSEDLVAACAALDALFAPAPTRKKKA